MDENRNSILAKLYDKSADLLNDKGVRFICIALSFITTGILAYKVAICSDISLFIKIVEYISFVFALAVSVQFYLTSEDKYDKDLLIYRFGVDPVANKQRLKRDLENILSELFFAIIIGFIEYQRNGMQIFLFNGTKNIILLSFMQTMCMFYPFVLLITFSFVLIRYLITKIVIASKQEQDEAWPKIQKETLEICNEYSRRFFETRNDDEEFKLIGEIRGRIDRIRYINLFDKRYKDYILGAVIKTLLVEREKARKKMLRAYAAQQIKKEFAEYDKTGDELLKEATKI